MPEGSIPKGLLKAFIVQSAGKKARPRSTCRQRPILNEAVRAQQILARSTTSRATCGASPATTSCAANALTVERWNRLHPDQPKRTPYLLEALKGAEAHRGRQRLHEGRGGSAFPRLPGASKPWHRRFGRSENREYLRRHFEINAESIAAAALSRFAREGSSTQEDKGRLRDLGVDPRKIRRPKNVTHARQPLPAGGLGPPIKGRPEVRVT